MKVRGNAAEGHRSILCGDVVNKSPRWSAGKARLSARAGGAPFAKVPQETCAGPALRSLTYGEGKEKRKALAPRLLGRGR